MRQGDTLCWVYSTASDTRKEEFSPPADSPLYTGKQNEAYIEALDDERFGVCVGIPSSVVKRYGADSVCIELDIDRRATSLALVLKAKDTQLHICEKIDSFTCMKENSWQECGFAFRKMSLDEDLILSHEEAHSEIKSFGSIRVTIMRGFSYERQDRDGGIIPTSNRRLDQHVSSKKVIKDNGISHSVNTPVLRSLPTRRGTPPRFSHLQEHWHIATFIFRYRSHMSLEMKRIIGDEQVSSLGQASEREEIQSRRQTPSGKLKVETQLPATFPSSSPPSSSARSTKRGSMHIEDFERINISDTRSPTKRRKSFAEPVEAVIKQEPGVDEAETFRTLSEYRGFHE